MPAEFDFSGLLSKDFAKPSPKGGGRAVGQRRGVGKRVRGSVHKGRRVPATKQEIALVARIKERQSILRSARAEIKFSCQRCGKETNSAVATGTTCHVCVAEIAVASDRAAYLTVTRKMARYAAQGRSTGQLFRQAMRTHDRILRTLLGRGVDEKQARAYVEAMLDESQKLGGRIAVPKLGDLLRKMGVKVEA